MTEADRQTELGRAETAPPAHMLYGGYFERQHAGFCGKHALNNLIGMELFTAEDLHDACQRYLGEQAMRGLLQDGEDASMHMTADGWYSSEVLAWALSNTVRLFGPDSAEHEMLLTELHGHEEIFRSAEVIGALQNRGNAHWIAIRKEGDAVWLLDSMCEPRRLEPAAVSAQFRQHRTYAVRRLS